MFIDKIEDKVRKEPRFLLCFEKGYDEFFPFVHMLEEIGVQIENPFERMRFMHVIRDMEVCISIEKGIDETKMLISSLPTDDMNRILTTTFEYLRNKANK